jgi:hypothetical protein
MMHLFTFGQCMEYNKHSLQVSIIVESIKVSAACLSRLLQEQQLTVLLLEAQVSAVLQQSQ